MALGKPCAFERDLFNPITHKSAMTFHSGIVRKLISVFVLLTPLSPNRQIRPFGCEKSACLSGNLRDHIGVDKSAQSHHVRSYLI